MFNYLKNCPLVIILFLTIFCVRCQSISKEPQAVKIACVGNSITYGAGMADREMNAYPEQLQAMLGDGYQVENFGVNGNTLLKKGDFPYWKSKKYQEALEFVPDIVFIKLGTNDSKLQNRSYLDSDFRTDYTALIESFKAKNKDARIVMLLPVPSFLPDSTSIWNPVIKKKIIPLTQKVAYDTQSEVIDLYQLFVDRPDLFPDTIHPSDLGGARIAERLYEVVVRNSINSEIDLSANKKVEPTKEANFYGFALSNFNFDGVQCKLARPKKTAKGMPWVLRARFWGHEPQTDIALLERGFHIAYCDVSNLFGNQNAVDRWNAFYKLMTQAGLSKKVALEGMSRGGLIIYNWAEQNAEKVACVYADAPVLNGKSWPGGMINGQGSPEDWKRFKAVYNLQNTADITAFKDNPIHKIKSIAKGGYPMLHVCGETDKVVPIAENTVPFVEGIQQLGGNITAVYKANNGHHPHSLKNPTQIVDFILRATDQKPNFALVPSPSAEYRQGAGWTKGTHWHTQAKDIDSLCQTLEKIDLLLIGNSITQGFGGNRPHTTYQPGKTATDAHFKNLKWINAGISGDRTQHVIWRLQNGHYERAQPKTVALTIGVNNFPFQNDEEIIAGIKEVLQVSTKKFPDSKIMLFGPLPTGTKPNSAYRKKYNAIHEALGNLKLGDNISYHEISKRFTDAEGNLDSNLYSSDGIHLKPEGYEVWATYIRKEIDKN